MPPTSTVTTGTKKKKTTRRVESTCVLANPAHAREYNELRLFPKNCARCVARFLQSLFSAAIVDHVMLAYL